MVRKLTFRKETLQILESLNPVEAGALGGPGNVQVVTLYTCPLHIQSVQGSICVSCGSSGGPVCTKLTAVM